jgi:hypothetical protein
MLSWQPHAFCFEFSEVGAMALKRVGNLYILYDL